MDEKWTLCLEKWNAVLNKTPDIHAILFLIGIQESGLGLRMYSKEQKQDLMHIGMCVLLVSEGYFSLDYFDEEGWPHYTQNKPLPYKTLSEQERFMQQKIIEYTDTHLS